MFNFEIVHLNSPNLGCQVLKTGLRALKYSQALAADSLPSVCFYSVMNSGVSVSAIETSDDSSLLAIGFTNSHIKV